MRKQKKQDLLTIVIILLVLALIMLVGSIAYEEMINMNKQQTENTISPEVEEDEEDTTISEEEYPIENEVEVEENEQEQTESTEESEEYLGEEENNEEENDVQSNDEKAINLAKKQWGNDDSVTFNIEQKNGTKYYVVVRSQTTALQWYEVDIETWEISEY